MEKPNYDKGVEKPDYSNSGDQAPVNPSKLPEEKIFDEIEKSAAKKEISAHKVMTECDSEM